MILQHLAMLLQDPNAGKVTTALLANKVGVSEAALYRHFASKAQMYDALVDFAETSIFSLINEITRQKPNGLDQFREIIVLLLRFSRKNPGITRLLIGDPVLTDDNRIIDRVNEIVKRVQLLLKQSLKLHIAAFAPGDGRDADTEAEVAMSFVLGRWQRFVRSDFKLLPDANMDSAVAWLLR